MKISSIESSFDCHDYPSRSSLGGNGEVGNCHTPVTERITHGFTNPEIDNQTLTYASVEDIFDLRTICRETLITET